MKMLKIMCVILSVMLMVVSVSAQEVYEYQAEMYGLGELEGALQGNAGALMRDFEPFEQTNVSSGFLQIFKKAVSGSGNVLKHAVSLMIRILVIVILCQLAQSVFDEKIKKVAVITGSLAILASCSSDINTMVGLGRKTINEISDFTSLLLPVMVSAATAAGSVTGAGVMYTLSVFFSNILLRFCNDVMVPAAYAYLALALTDAVVQHERLKKLRELLGWGIEKGLKAVVYLFAAVLSATGILSGTADTAALKAAKFAVSGTVPVVGGIISDSVSSVLAGAALLKSSVGTFGMLAIFAVLITPFLNIGISYIIMKLSSALSGIFESAHCGLLEAVSSVMGYMLAMTASSAMIAMLSCCFLAKSVQV